MHPFGPVRAHWPFAGSPMNRARARDSFFVIFYIRKINNVKEEIEFNSIVILAYAKRLRFTNYLVRLGGNLAQLSIGGGEIGIAIWQHMFLNFGEHFVKFRFDEHKKLLIYIL